MNDLRNPALCAPATEKMADLISEARSAKGAGGWKR